MNEMLFCTDENRKAQIRAIDFALDGQRYNGIDYVEVLDADAPLAALKQRTLLVYCVRSIDPPLDGTNVRIEGGVRVNGVQVEWAFPFPAASASQPVAPAPLDTVLTPAEWTYLAGRELDDRVLVVRSDRRGDFSRYTLRLVHSTTDTATAPGFDPQLSAIDFAFKVDCPSDFDCAPDAGPATRALPAAPQIDYQARDYASLRRLMLDRLSVTVPEWRERNAGDVGIALVELLAYVGDHASYFQDAVATEAYLGTARLRTSVRRHARLVDYAMHDGANARAWIVVRFEPTDPAVVSVLLPGPTADAPGTMLLTQVSGPRGGLDPVRRAEALSEGATVFETMHDLSLRPEHNEIHFYTWGNEKCRLRAGATRATIRRKSALADGSYRTITALGPGDLLLFEEVRDPTYGEPADADTTRRHVVRLVEVVPSRDPLFSDEEDDTKPVQLLEIAWHPDDALPFALDIFDVAAPAPADGSSGGEPPLVPVSVARGNVVLADHGRSIGGELLPLPTTSQRYRPTLHESPVTQQGHVRSGPTGRLVPVDADAPASAALRWDLGETRAAVALRETGVAGQRWTPQRDLLSSDRFAPEFVVEMRNDGRGQLRFGDDVLGRAPSGELVATYRIGNGREGNVSAEAIAHVVTTIDGITDVRNPLPAFGGTEPEPIEQVRLYAPQAFRTQERAITESDYVEVAERHPSVQRAAATRRWTGSWFTMFVTIDRRGGFGIDDAYEREMRRHLERFRLAGYDIEIDAPRFVSLDLALTVCVAPGYFRSNVKQVLLETFSNMDLPNGARGFFHPDNFTFGQPVYLSHVIAAAMGVAGVSWVETERFQRWGEDPHGELADGQISFGRLEIARLDNDASLAENGRIEFDLRGGL